ncbi:MAG: hypothetical protein IJS25_06780 [Bacteroidales bacterium]|nr:hypothetical protein [Bacteroidales bacterium]
MKHLLFKYLLTICCMIAPCLSIMAQVPVKSLGGRTGQAEEGITWGIPFQKGEIKKGQTFTLTADDGSVVPVESWPLAYWPDGSLKWVGFAAVSDAHQQGWTLQAQKLSGKNAGKAIPAQSIARETGDGILVETGSLTVLIPSSGDRILQDMSINGTVVASGGQLVCYTDEYQVREGQTVTTRTAFTGRVEKVTLLQAGALRAAVKIEGKHYTADGRESWLPFAVYCYFYKGLSSVKLVHSFIFDGKDDTAISGLGITFTVPFREELHNRHVRFAGDGRNGTGFWVQPVRLLPGYRPSAGQVIVDTYADHLDGKRMPDLAEYAENTRTAIESCPIWGDMRLLQTHPNGFSIDKRTSEAGSWVHVTDGGRSLGGALLGDVSGSIFVGIKDFWQKYPSAIDIRQADKEAGTLTAWFWTPDAEPMNLCSYDTLPHGLNINYEDWKPGWASPYGIANASELNIRLFPDIPDNSLLLDVAKDTQEPLQFVSTPEYYYAQKAFGGYWGLPDRQNPVNAAIESELDRTIAYLQGQVEQRYWYGFWDYGDIMHNYDFGRHEWRYDVGGWAWNNTELMPDIFLWISFLRTGRDDIWRMAEAMVRHSSEVDVHHMGRFAPLGTRHNVTHWGDGAKQPRISHANLKRIYYYLTADDLTGDLMHEQLTADATYDYVKRIDTRNPVSGTYITHGLGTDWCSYAVNWMTEWERTGNIYWRDRLVNSMRDMVALGQNGMFGTGLYDPETGRYMKLVNTPEPVPGTPQGRMGFASNNAPKSDYAPAADIKQKKDAVAPAGRGGGGAGYFDMIFGGPEFMCELKTMVDNPEFWEGWKNICTALSTTSGNNMTGPRAAAYAAYVSNDKELGALAWKNLLDNANGTPAINTHAPGATVSSDRLVNAVEDPIFLGQSAGWQLHNPSTVQWMLNAIEVMEFAKDYRPAALPELYKKTLNY